MMNRQAFHFELPPHLIAQFPLPNRRDSRLLVYQRQPSQLHHQQFSDLTAWLQPGDLLVFNDTRVIPARLYGRKATGGQVELLVERIVSATTFYAHIKASKTLKPGGLVYLEHNWVLEVLNKLEALYHCRVVTGDVMTMLQTIGHIPLPPYIARADETSDVARYQTIYARHDGSVAAPTAGLHFDEAMFAQLHVMGVQIDYVTLHVGAGTFQPVRVDSILEHRMHRESFVVSSSLCERIAATHKAGKRVIAVGTTAMRSLESAARTGQLQAISGETDIFIYPGFQFNVCDGLITNFHLPESTLLMLVAAFIGYEQAMSLYQTAIQEQYRFFSYGDVSFLC